MLKHRTRRTAQGAFESGKGLMAEWLGTALQKLLQRFKSASDLEAIS